MKTKISASLDCANYLALLEDVRKLERAGIEMLHIDVMDGVFVPNFAIGFVLSPMGPYFPHFTLTSSLYGVIPGVVSLLPFRSKTLRTFCAVAIPQVGVGLFLTPYFLHTLFDMPWKILLIPRLVSVPLNTIAFTVLILSLFRVPAFAAFGER